MNNSMRFLIITYDDYFNIPYIRNYEQMLKEQNCDYDIVLWNRSGQEVQMHNVYIFQGKDHYEKLRKVGPFLAWRRFVRHRLRKEHYDRLIVLTTMPAVLLADLLLGEYRGKFWLDIRDFTHENLLLYKSLVAKLVTAAAASSISSPAFRQFLPNSGNIFLTHNISNQDAAELHCTLDVGKRPLNIGFVGGIQFVAQNQIILRQFANNPNYKLKYIGKAHLGCDLQPFCIEYGIKNVEFRSTFTNEQKPAIYQDIQLINSIYGCESQVVKLLLPNRLYDSVLFKKPILVSKGTYLADVVSEYGLGVALDVEKENIVQVLEDYLANFDREKFDQGCRFFLAKVEDEIKEYKQALCYFCSGESLTKITSFSKEFI